MADPVRSAARYKARYKVGRAKTSNELRDEVAKRYEVGMTELTAMEGRVKEIIHAFGVSGSQYVPYLNFGRQLHKLNRQERVSDENFAMAAQVLLDKWAARGCDPKVLAKIRKDVFDIDVPKT
jgi:hypothetical protein